MLPVDFPQLLEGSCAGINFSFTSKFQISETYCLRSAPLSPTRNVSLGCFPPQWFFNEIIKQFINLSIPLRDATTCPVSLCPAVYFVKKNSSAGYSQL